MNNSELHQILEQAFESAGFENRNPSWTITAEQIRTIWSIAWTKGYRYAEADRNRSIVQERIEQYGSE